MQKLKHLAIAIAAVMLLGASTASAQFAPVQPAPTIDCQATPKLEACIDPNASPAPAASNGWDIPWGWILAIIAIIVILLVLYSWRRRPESHTPHHDGPHGPNGGQRGGLDLNTHRPAPAAPAAANNDRRDPPPPAATAVVTRPEPPAEPQAAAVAIVEEPAPAAPAASDPDLSALDKALEPDATILMIDNDKTIQALVRSYLPGKIRLMVAANEAEATALTADTKIDLVLTANNDKVDGLAIARKGIAPTIMLEDVTHDVDRNKAREAGAVDVINPLATTEKEFMTSLENALLGQNSLNTSEPNGNGGAKSAVKVSAMIVFALGLVSSAFAQTATIQPTDTQVIVAGDAPVAMSIRVAPGTHCAPQRILSHQRPGLVTFTDIKRDRNVVSFKAQAAPQADRRPFEVVIGCNGTPNIKTGVIMAVVGPDANFVGQAAVRRMTADMQQRDIALADRLRKLAADNQAEVKAAEQRATNRVAQVERTVTNQVTTVREEQAKLAGHVRTEVARLDLRLDSTNEQANSNFAQLKTAVERLQARVAALEARDKQLAEAIGVNAGAIDALAGRKHGGFLGIGRKPTLKDDQREAYKAYLVSIGITPVPPTLPARDKDK